MNFTETVSDLTARIKIHQQYGTRDIDQWMLSILSLKPGLKILDIGCGTGKQCFLMEEALKGRCEIIGADVSHSLLKKANEEKIKRKSAVQFTFADFNKPLPFQDGTFQLVTCCFALYYARNIPFTIQELKRVSRCETSGAKRRDLRSRARSEALRGKNLWNQILPEESAVPSPGRCEPRTRALVLGETSGKLFVTGPLPENKEIFYRIIEEATGKPIPFMPGRAKFGSEILETIQKTFRKTEVYRFENPLIFKETKPFLDYTRASLSEDRKLWKNLFSDESFDDILKKIEKRAEEELENQGRIVMTKVVGGFIATN